MQTIESMVREAIKNARENGQDEFIEGPAADVAGDMIAYDEDIGTWWSDNGQNDAPIIAAIEAVRTEGRPAAILAREQ